MSGKVVAITGGARGIGRATAVELQRRGARVAIGDIDRDLAAALADELGEGTIGLPLDVSDRDSFESFLSSTEKTLGPLDVLVNSAGIMPLGPFVGESDEVSEQMISVNIEGVILGCKVALGRFLPRASGQIVNIAGVAGRVGFAGAVTYTATQHAVVGLTAALRSELRETGVEAQVVMPVLVDTEMVSGLRGLRGRRTVRPDEAAIAIVRAIELGQPETFIPRTAGRMLRLGAVLPRSLGRGVSRSIGADRLLADPDPGGRAEYEARIASSRTPDPATTLAHAADSVASAVARESRGR